MKKLFSVQSFISIFICAILFIGRASISQAYTWLPYNGHEYAVTAALSWDAEESEAVLQGGHLVTINDVTENTWLAGTFASSEPGDIPGVNIGYYLNFSDDWTWISGESVTYENLWTDWGLYTGPHAYLHTNNHPSAPGGTWNHAGWHTDPPGIYGYLRGVIERPATSVPEPTTMLLLGLGLIGVAGARRKIKK